MGRSSFGIHVSSSLGRWCANALANHAPITISRFKALWNNTAGSLLYEWIHFYQNPKIRSISGVLISWVFDCYLIVIWFWFNVLAIPTFQCTQPIHFLIKFTFFSQMVSQNFLTSSVDVALLISTVPYQKMKWLKLAFLQASNWLFPTGYFFYDVHVIFYDAPYSHLMM